MKNTVELLGFYGSDETHAQSAWTSTSRDLTEEKKERIPKLLTMLASEGHHTPFEKSSLHFLVTVDQATHIHLLKHRVGVSINGESARYKELKEDKFIVPYDWNVVPTRLGLVKQQVGYKKEDEPTWKDILEEYVTAGNWLYHECLADLTPVLGRKRAKESARFFKTMNSQITMDVMFNWRSFMHFMHLRNDEHAQKEVMHVAQEMLRLVRTIPGDPFKHSLEAFGY